MREVYHDAGGREALVVLLHVPVPELRHLDEVDVFGGGADGAEAGVVEVIERDGGLVLEGDLPGRGKGRQQLEEHDAVQCCHQQVGGVSRDLEVSHFGLAVVHLRHLFLIHPHQQPAGKTAADRVSRAFLGYCVIYDRDHVLIADFQDEGDLMSLWVDFEHFLALRYHH